MNPKIQIDGKEYPVLPGRTTLRMYARQKGISDVGGKKMGEILFDLSLDDQDLLTWCSLKTGCSVEGIEFPYSFEEFQKILDEHPEIVAKLDEFSDEQMPKNGEAVKEKS